MSTLELWEAQDRNRALTIALLMCATHCQGGHSDAGAEVAKVLGIKFPLTMENLAKFARKQGLDPDKLWPWWRKMREERARGFGPGREARDGA